MNLWRAAVAFEGLRAGVGLLRVVLDFPARGLMGPIAYAAYFRATDLTTRGVVFYALYGFLALLFTGAWWWASRRRSAAVAALASVAVLLMTTMAAPIAFQIKGTTDPVVLDGLFDHFIAWSVARILCVFVSFGALVAGKP